MPAKPRIRTAFATMQVSHQSEDGLVLSYRGNNAVTALVFGFGAVMAGAGVVLALPLASVPAVVALSGPGVIIMVVAALEWTLYERLTLDSRSRTITYQEESLYGPVRWELPFSSVVGVRVRRGWDEGVRGRYDIRVDLECGDGLRIDLGGRLQLWSIPQAADEALAIGNAVSSRLGVQLMAGTGMQGRF